MPLSESLVDIAWRELFSAVCVCGAAKKPHQSFCRECYFALPKGLRNRLYLSMSEGYAEIYDEAKDFLKIETDRCRR
jgi:hypothetical protein